MKLFVHRKTVRYYDYGDLLETAHGIAWSSDGDPDFATGFERGQTVAGAITEFAALAPPEGWEIVEGPAIERSHDMNPRGDI